MNILKNKHVILAMFVAPVLAIIAYFATDRIVSEKPHQAQQGNSYKLAAKSNCRYKSGLCTLHNGDVEVNVRVEQVSDAAFKLILQSNMPLTNALASFANGESEAQPGSLYPAAAQENTWNAEFRLADIEKTTLRLVLEISDSIFYAETPAIFADYETTFTRDNFSR
jgi:hypothetical protein